MRLFLLSFNKVSTETFMGLSSEHLCSQVTMIGVLVTANDIGSSYSLLPREIKRKCHQITVYDWGWGRFLRKTILKPIGQTCEGRCGTWFFNKSRGIYPGDHFAKMSLHAFQSLFSKVDFSKVPQQCHIDIFVYRANLSNSTQWLCLLCTCTDMIIDRFILSSMQS